MHFNVGPVIAHDFSQRERPPLYIDSALTIDCTLLKVALEPLRPWDRFPGSRQLGSGQGVTATGVLLPVLRSTGHRASMSWGTVPAYLRCRRSRASGPSQPSVPWGAQGPVRGLTCYCSPVCSLVRRQQPGHRASMLRWGPCLPLLRERQGSGPGQPSVARPVIAHRRAPRSEDSNQGTTGLRSLRGVRAYLRCGRGRAAVPASLPCARGSRARCAA